jgi:hypothetical protein
MPGFQALLVEQRENLGERGLSLVTITTTTVTRAHVWMTFRRTHDGRWRERYHSILLLMEGKSCPEMAQWF